MAPRQTRKARPVREMARPEVSRGGVCKEQGLPLPFVHYPNHYGAFFAFSEREDSTVHLCECGRPALQNLVALNMANAQPKNSNPLRNAKLDSFHVPDAIAILALQEGLKASRFQRGLCHRCNLATPGKRWCHEMYGGEFKQRFGWCIQQAYLRLGIRPSGHDYLPDLCPPSFRNQIELIRAKSDDAANSRANGLASESEREARKLMRTLSRSVENIVRQEFGFRKVGEGWVSETLLFQVVSRLFSGEQILRHHRPEWLEGLELDIFVPRWRLGIEYQGQQHFRPVKAWGGERALCALQERDKRKRHLCQQAGILLLEIDYTEALDDSHVRSRIAEAGMLKAGTMARPFPMPTDPPITDVLASGRPLLSGELEARKMPDCAVSFPHALVQVLHP